MALHKQDIPITAFKVDDLQKEYARLKALKFKYTMEPTSNGPVLMAIWDDKCGNLIQLYQIKENN